MSGPKREDLTGVHFGRWTAQYYVEGTRPTKWWCVCDCGIERAILAGALKKGGSLSCGCYIRDITSARSLVHGRADGTDRTYRTWCRIKERCYTPTHKDYPRWGGVGIQVCDRWRFGENGLSGFECFLLDMGEHPEGYSIDRRDGTKHYSPDNCRWATAKEQANNRKSTVFLTVDGITKPLSEWCDIYGIGSKTVLYRLKHTNLNHKEALTLTPDKGHRHTRK